MNLLVVAAVSQELEGFRKKGLQTGVSTLVTGMGKKNAASRVSQWLAQNSVDAIGSIDPIGSSSAIRTNSAIDGKRACSIDLNCAATGASSVIC